MPWNHLMRCAPHGTQRLHLTCSNPVIPCQPRKSALRELGGSFPLLVPRCGQLHQTLSADRFRSGRVEHRGYRHHAPQVHCPRTRAQRFQPLIPPQRTEESQAPHRANMPLSRLRPAGSSRRTVTRAAASGQLVNTWCNAAYRSALPASWGPPCLMCPREYLGSITTY